MRSQLRKSPVNKKYPLAQLIRAARLQNNYSQKDIAKKLKIGPMYISNIECGKCPVPIKYLKQMISIYGLEKKQIISLLIEAEKEKLERQLGRS